MLKLAHSVETALEKVDTMEKEAIDLGPSLEQVINRNNEYRDSREQTQGEPEKDEEEI